MKNGLIPLIALKVYGNPCVACNLYKRLDKTFDRVKYNMFFGY